MSRKPLISVIVPTKNSAKFLRQCLESVKNQSYKNIEIIVVDNNSVDDTKKIARQFTKKVYNCGPERSAQVNFGVKKSKGKYVYRVDSDFILDKRVVVQCIKKIQQGFDAVVVHDSPNPNAGWLAKIRKFEIDMYKYDLTYSAARFVKKEVFQKIGGYNEVLIAGEDYDFQNRLNRTGYKTGFIVAEATHLDKSKSFWWRMKKYYIYGKDFVNLKRVNPNTFRVQLRFWRPIYLENWRKFIRHPFLGLGFIFYHFFKFSLGGLGYFVGKLQSKRQDKLARKDVIIAISQSFLPARGGQISTIHAIVQEAAQSGLADVEIVCLTGESLKIVKENDQKYNLPIFRTKIRPINLIKKLSVNFNSLVGGRQKPGFWGRISMLLVALIVVSFLGWTTLKRVWANRQNIIILQCHTLAALLVGVLCQRIFKEYKIRVLFISHFVYQKSGFWLADQITKTILKRINFSLCLSQAAAQTLISEFNLNSKKVNSFRIWIYPAKLKPYLSRSRQLRRLKSNKIKILFVGRILPEKGIKEIINLANYIDKSNLDNQYTITVIGDSNHPIQQELIHFSQNSHCLNYLGRVDQPRLWQYHLRNDVFLMPSQWAEAAGNVILESYAFGLPVVGSNRGGIPEYLQKFKFHRLINCFDPKTILSAIDSLFVEVQQAGHQRVISNSHRVLRERFSSANFGVFQKIFQVLIKNLR